MTHNSSSSHLRAFQQVSAATATWRNWHLVRIWQACTREMSWGGTGYNFPLSTPNLKISSWMDTSLLSFSHPARYSPARISSFSWLWANQSLPLLCFLPLLWCWGIRRKSATCTITPHLPGCGRVWVVILHFPFLGGQPAKTELPRP